MGRHGRRALMGWVAAVGVVAAFSPAGAGAAPRRLTTISTS